MKDPTLTEYAKTLNISTEALRKRMRKAGITGYKNPSNKRETLLTLHDRTLITTNTQTETPTSQPIPQLEVEVIEVTPYQAPEFVAPNRTGAIELLRSDVAHINTQAAGFLDNYVSAGLEEFAAAGAQLGFQKAQVFRMAEQAAIAQGLQGGNVTPMQKVTVGKSEGAA
jgi:hypothetical protein